MRAQFRRAGLTATGPAPPAPSLPSRAGKFAAHVSLPRYAVAKQPGNLAPRPEEQQPDARAAQARSLLQSRGDCSPPHEQARATGGPVGRIWAMRWPQHHLRICLRRARRSAQKSPLESLRSTQYADAASDRAAGWSQSGISNVAPPLRPLLAGSRTESAHSSPASGPRPEPGRPMSAPGTPTANGPSARRSRRRPRHP